MSPYENALRLFEELDGLDDTFIEEAMLPDAALTLPLRGHGPRCNGKSPLRRFLGSGWAVAMLCAVVSVSVLVALVRLGVGNPAGDMTPPENNRPADGVTGETLPSETDEPVTLPPEAQRVPAGTASVDQSGLRYISNGDGTCTCMGLATGEEPTVLHIPDYSPDGDAVTAIYAYAFRNCLGLTEVTLPAGLRGYDRDTFPMEAEIYHLCGNILYLGSDDNPYMVAISTADNRPGATSLHPHTRILADRALTYDSGSYFALKWKDRIPAYTDSEVFSLPSCLAYIGEYALLDVGRDITYNGHLVGWDALTEKPHTGLARAADGRGVNVICLDGQAETAATDTLEVKLDSTAYVENGILFGGYFSYYRGINEDYYAWLADPASFSEGPDQFVTVSAIFGKTSRVLTADELASVSFTLSGTADPALAAFAEAYNDRSAPLYAGKSVVMLYLQESALRRHAVAGVSVTDGRIRVTLTREAADTHGTAGARTILIPLDDPDGTLAGSTVTYDFVE